MQTYSETVTPPESLGAWSTVDLRDSPTDTGQLLEKLHEAVSQAVCQTPWPAVWHLLAQKIQATFACRAVMLGMVHGRRRCRLVGWSGSRSFDRHSDMVRAAESAMHHATLCDKAQRESTSAIGVDRWDESSDSDDVKRLLRLSQAACISPRILRNPSGDLLAVLLVWHDAPSELDDRTIDRGAAFLGPYIDLLRRAQPGIISRWRASLSGSLSRYRWWATAMASLAIAGLLALPVPYAVRCSCVVQPAVRRYVVAPYEGRLEAAFVEPGDTVHRGQTVARMDAREVRWELAGLEADLTRARKERDSGLALEDTAAAQIAALEMARLEQTIRLWRDRAENLEVKSPIDGVVISGEPRRLESSRLTVGQTLVEVAPLDRMIVELEIPDSEIRHVRKSLTVRMRFDALPGHSFPSKLYRVHPRSEERNGHNVFIAQVALTDTDGSLRPGMNGRAKIIGPRHALGWNLFHKVWEYALYRWGW